MRGQRLPALTSLRFVAAALVVIVHSYGHFGFPAQQPPGISFVQAVSFFFVLSGFVLCYAHPSLDIRGAGRFLLTRAARFWPVHVATLILIFLAFPFILPGRPVYGTPWVYVFANLGLVHAWWPRYWSFFSGNDVSWSISAEWLFALCFPLLLARTWKGWMRSLLITAILAAGMIFLANHLLMAHKITADFGSGTIGTKEWGTLGLVYINPLARLMEFTIGMTVCALWKYVSPYIHFHRVLATALEILMLALAWWEMSHTAWFGRQPWIVRHFGGAGLQWLTSSAGGVVFFAGIVFVFALGQGWVAQFLSYRPCVFLGEISFAVYMTHHIAIRYIANYPQRVHAEDWRSYIVFWLVVLGASAALYLLIERPAVNGMRRLLRRRPEPQPILTPAVTGD